MGVGKQPRNFRKTGTLRQSTGSVSIALLLLSPLLAGCSSSSSWSTPRASSQGTGLPPTPTSYTAANQPPTPVTAARPIADGVHPDQSITDLFRDSTSPQTAVPRPPSSYTPAGQPYSPPPPGQPAYDASQSAAGLPTASAAASPPPETPPLGSDGVHPNQSITDLFRQ